MIFKSNNNFPVNSTLDGGDSAMRAGIMLLTGMPYAFDPSKYEISPGWLTRCPDQGPDWTNRLNFTRDQLLPLMAGLNKIGRHDIARRVALMHILRLGFCQDFQKDIPGTWKCPWPHTYADGTYSAFNFADPTTPADWWLMIVAGRLYPLMLLFPICLIFMWLSILMSVNNKEQNQLIASLSAYPKFMRRFYLILVPNWSTYNRAYWETRNEGEYAQAIAKMLNNR